MVRSRIIPCLLLKGAGLVKTVQFKEPKYVGDPINAVKIFNDKGADELVFLDISASLEGRAPSMNLIRQIASEAFMPVGYGGGIKTIEQIKEILSIGIEKIIINSEAVANPKFVAAACSIVGAQSVVGSIDVKRNFWGKNEVVTLGATQNTKLNPVEYAKQLEKLGVGELLINSVDRDGTMSGYDIDLIKSVADAVSIPVIACGGAAGVQDFKQAIDIGHASAVAAGSMFVFHGRHRAVLISYPNEQQINEL